MILITLAFQNCGDNSRQRLVQIGQVEEASSNSCRGSECFLNPELLFVLIREFEPYRIDIRSISAGHFNVGGQCGVGSFPSHAFDWELREAFGAQNLVGQGSVDDRCDLGQFQIPVGPNIQGRNVVVDQRYQLDVELVGFSDQTGQVVNPLPSGRARLDIIFEFPEN